MRTFVCLTAALLLLAPLSTSASDHGERGYLGIYLQKVEGGLAEALDLEENSGVLVNQVIDDAPAAAAGLQPGDIIVEIDGEKVTRPVELRRKIQNTEPGDQVTIEYLRDGETETVEVILAQRNLPRPPRPPRAPHIVRDLRFESERGYLGVVTQDLSAELGEYFGVENGEGALVSEVREDSPASELGLQAGDVIVEVDGQPTRDGGELRDAIRDFDEETEVEVVWIRDQKEKSGTVTLEIRESEDMTFGRLFGNFDVEVPDFRRHVRMHVDGDAMRGEVREMMKQLKEELEEVRREMEEMKQEIQAD